jgi:hypothetical protein
MHRRWRSRCVGVLSAVSLGTAVARGGAWFKKWHFQVTPEIDRALIAKGFLVLSVTLI